jgi:hypothetical protein
MSRIDRDQLYVLEQLQPRILLSATDAVLDDAAAATDNVPAIDETAQIYTTDIAVDDGSGDVKPDGIFYIRGGLKTGEDVPADDTAVIDDGTEISPEGIVLDQESHFRTLGGALDESGGDVAPDGIMYTLGGIADSGEAVDPVDAGAGDDGIMYTLGTEDPANLEDVKPDGIFHTNPDAVDPNATDDGVLYTMGAEDPANLEDVKPDGIFHLNPDAVDPNATTDDAGNVDPQLFEFSIQSAPTPAAPEAAPAEAPAADTGAVVATPVASQPAAAAQEANPLLSKKDDLLTGDGNVLA